jgi:GxxExxY protein
MFTNQEKIILELKCAKMIENAHRAQALNYLKATGKRLAIILNFAGKKLEYERLAF